MRLFNTVTLRITAATTAERKFWTAKITEVVTRICGGATVETQAKGTYVHKDGHIVSEPSWSVTGCTSDLDALLPALFAVMSDWLVVCDQESALVTIDGHAFLIFTESLEADWVEAMA